MMALVNIRLHHATPGNSAGPFASVTGLRAGCGSVTSAARVSSASPALPQTDPRTVTGPSAVELGSGPTAGDANPNFVRPAATARPAAEEFGKRLYVEAWKRKELDVWIPVKSLSEPAGVPDPEIRGVLTDGHPVRIMAYDCWLRLKTADDAQKLIAQLKQWATQVAKTAHVSINSP
jgi:hypothetical protein